jgi:hypothetical protein
VLDQAAQHGQVHRLADEIEGAGLQRANRGVLVAEGGDHRHRRFRVKLGDLADQVHAGAVGQAHVGQAQGVAVLPQQGAGIGERGRGIAAQSHAALACSTMLTAQPLAQRRQQRVVCHRSQVLHVHTLRDALAAGRTH